MALWELDEFKPPQFLGFVRDVFNLGDPANYQGQRWLPNETTDDLSFEYIKGAGGRTAMATILSFDAEAPIAQRRGLGEKIGGELPPIKRKARIGEKEIIRFLQPRSGTADVQNALGQVYNDAADLVDSVRARLEWLRLQALSTDRIVYSEDGVTFSFDYGLDGTLQWNVSTKKDNASRDGSSTDNTIDTGGAWTDTANSTPIDDLVGIVSALQDRGITPAEVVLSPKALRLIYANEHARLLARGPNSTTSILTVSELNGLLDQYALPPLRTYDARVTTEAADGSLSEVRCMAENKAFVPAGVVGNTLIGPTAESRALLGTPFATAMPGVWGETYATDEPPAEWVKVAAVAFPTLPQADRLAQLTLW